MARTDARRAAATRSRCAWWRPGASKTVAAPAQHDALRPLREPDRNHCIRRLAPALLISLSLLPMPGARAAKPAVAHLPVRVAGARTEVVEVSASIAPLAWMIERIGGRHVRTSVLIPPFASPESFAPRPSQLEALTRARLVVVVGHPDLVFERRVLQPFLKQHGELPIVDFYAASASERNPGARPAAEPPSDPHVWLSPARVLHAAPSIASSLSMLDPAHADAYDAGLRALVSDVEALDDALHARFGRSDEGETTAAASSSTARLFLVQHPAWGWLAHDYGLAQVSIEREGKQAGPRRLVALIAWAKLSGVRRILVESGHPAHSARLIAREIDARVVAVDPMAHDWLANLREVAQEIDAAAVEARSGLSAP